MVGPAVVLSVWSQDSYLVGNFHQELLPSLWLVVLGRFNEETLALFVLCQAVLTYETRVLN